jgi:hypothetical protein
MFCGPYGESQRMRSILHELDVQLYTAPRYVEGIHRSLAQWNVALEIKIPAYRTALSLSLSLFNIIAP